MGGKMPKLILLCAAVIVLSLVQPASAQAIFDAGAWTEFYTYEVPDQDNSQIRSLQGVRLRGRNIGVPGLGFFFRGRVASDLSEKLATDSDFRSQHKRFQTRVYDGKERLAAFKECCFCQ